MVPVRSLLQTVYVVDDDPSVRTALVRLIRSDGWQARAFESGSALLDALAEAGPGCVVLDICMPGLTGYDVINWIEAHAPALPVVALSSLDDAATRARAARAEAFLRKPVADHELLGAVGAAMNRRAAQPHPHEAG